MQAALVAQGVALASAAGVSTYATVALLGLASRMGWIGELPPTLGALADWWVIGLATALYAVEFLATLVPGVASAWEAVHSAFRPLAGAALAAGAVWHADPRLSIVAALLGGTLALGAQTTKLGARVAIDHSPEPFTNGAANVAELGYAATIALLVWQHPWIALGIAVTTIVVMALAVRAVWRMLGRVLGGRRSSA